MSPSPLIFEPIYKPRPWGGRRIFSYFDRPPAGDGPIGESWELADLESDQSVVAVGPAKGRTLPTLMKEWGRALLGGVAPVQGRFPLLIKYLDARETLSIQVHPSRAVADRLGGPVRVKDEAWYILDAAPGSVIYHGLEPGVDAAGFRRAMTAGRVEGVLRTVPVRPGECYLLPSGLPHALGAGVLVAEVQSPSDVTYRAYDWGRVDPATGRPRELHLEAAIECIDFAAGSPPPMQPRAHVASLWTAVTRLVECPAFVIEHVRMVEGTEQAIPYAEPVVWIVLDGAGELLWGRGESLAFGPGRVILLPARLEEPRVRIAASTRWLEVSVPVASDLAGFEHPPPRRFSEPPTSLVQINLPGHRPDDKERT